MGRIIVTILLVLFLLSPLTAQELTVSGELKTGFYLEQEQIGNMDPKATGGMTNNDGDSGAGEGRIRMDFHLSFENIGLRFRFQIEPKGMGPFLPTWSYAYAYGNLFNEQLTISAGILGDSPWGTGGTELWREPEARDYIDFNHISKEPYFAKEGLMGIRFEYKPSFLPGLNLGFALNQPDQVAIDVQKQTFGDVLKETVVGAAYENDYFAAGVGFRFDGEADTYKNNIEEGSRLYYRLEERVLSAKVSGMKIWLNGSYYGIGSGSQDIEKNVNGQRIKLKFGSGEYLVNWLYWMWDADSFIAKLDTCFGIYQQYNNEDFKPNERAEYQSLEIRPAFYFKLFDNLFQAGVRAGFCMEFGNGKTYIDSPYQYFFVEPQIKLNFNNNAYIALLYNFTEKYAWPEGEIQKGDKSQKHWINLRAVYTF